VAEQEKDPSATLHLARRLIALRQSHPALRTGSMTMLDSPDHLLLFTRQEGNEGLLCAFNLGHEPIAWRPPSGWSVVQAVNCSDPWSGQLPPLAGLVLSEPR
jgi:alpha-glucosidase